MGGPGGMRAFLRRFAGLLGVCGVCVGVAGCSGGLSGKVDPRYGVASSSRVVEPGQPIPKGGGTYRIGKPYTIAGKTYVPEENFNYRAVGIASWYGDAFHGRYTANGEIFDENSISAAHPTMPLPSYARVTNLQNHRSVVVRVNDRGPYAHDRLIDLSVKTAKILGFYDNGTAKVKVEYVGRAPLAGSNDNKLMATLREPGHRHAAPVQVASNKPYAPIYFDSHPLTKLPERVQSPPERPYAVGEGRRQAAAAPPARHAPTTEFAAARRPHTVDNDRAPPPSDAVPRVSPVSAYAPVRYDAPAGYLGGRGLY
jgi:peptidoglycan lytic transglycosylase